MRKGMEQKLAAAERERWLQRPWTRSRCGWSTKLKIPKFQVAVFRGVANHVLPLVRRSLDYSLETSAGLFIKPRQTLARSLGTPDWRRVRCPRAAPQHSRKSWPKYGQRDIDMPRNPMV